ncbi:MAG: TraB/GumN family protein [Leucothrix sp.]
MTLHNKHFKSLLSATIATFFCTQLAVADSSVWKAEKDGKHLYLGGTIHVLSKDDYPLPEEYNQAYKKSAVVYFETDIQAMKDPEVAGKMMPLLMGKDGKTLDKVLKPETIEALEAFLKTRNLPMAMFNQFSPSGVYLVLLSMELASMGMTNAGVDMHFDNLAREDKKTLGELETLEQQMSFLSKIGEGDPDQLVLYTLRDLKELPEMMKSMKDAWRSGDRAKYREILLEPFIKDYPKTYQSLLVERNNNWMPKIEALFDTPEIELVLVGALHMIGKDGLLQQLEKKGYTVEPFAED